MARKKNRIRIHDVDGTKVLTFGRVEIWDGADMALLRDVLMSLAEDQSVAAVGVDLTYVKYIPSGFFGLLDLLQRQGTQVRLYAPQPHVRRMLWFQLFFEQEYPGCYKMTDQPRQEITLSLNSTSPLPSPSVSSENTNDQTSCSRTALSSSGATKP